MKWIGVIEWIGVIVIVAGVSSARAQSSVGVKAGPYEIHSMAGKGIEVRKGKQRAPLDAEHYLNDGNGDDKLRKLTLQISGCDQQPFEATYKYDDLEARIVNTAGLVLHRAKKFAQAAEKFAAATKLDPTWDLPVYNLASAYNLAGDAKAAIAALAPRLASDPVATYAAVVADPQLVSLLTAPELVALKAKPPVAGTKIATSSLDYAYAPDRGLVAYSLSMAGWLACVGENDIRIEDVASGKLVATIPLERASDFAGIHCASNPMEGVRTSDRKKLAARLEKRSAIADRVLADLGFVTSAGIEYASLDRNADKPKATLPKAKLGVVVGQRGTNVLRGNTTVGTYPGAATQVVLIPEVKAMVYVYTTQNEDGCPTEFKDVGKLAL